MNRKLWIGAAAAAAILLGGAGWYFLYYTKTPAYTVTLLTKAAAARDAAAFEKHMDLRSVLDKGFDDLTTAGLAAQSVSADDQEKLRQIAMTIKPAIVEGLRDYIVRAVQEGAWPDDGGSTQMAAIAARAGLTAFAPGAVSVLSSEGDAAVISVRVTHPDMKAPFDLQLHLSRLPDGTWQVRDAANFGDFLTALREGQKESLRAYIEATKPAVDAANAKRQALTAGDPAITPAFAASYGALIDELETELRKTEVPHGAKEFADMRFAMYDLMKAHMALIGRVGTNASEADAQKIRAQQAQLAALARQVQAAQKQAEQ